MSLGKNIILNWECSIIISEPLRSDSWEVLSERCFLASGESGKARQSSQKEPSFHEPKQTHVLSYQPPVS